MSDERDFEQLQALRDHRAQNGVMPAETIETKRLDALIEVMKADKAVDDAYYAWLDVSKDNNDTDNPEYKAWGAAMEQLARVASAYIDHHVHHHCLSPHLRPKDYQEDAIAKEARRQMGWG